MVPNRFSGFPGDGLIYRTTTSRPNVETSLKRWAILEYPFGMVQKNRGSTLRDEPRRHFFVR